MSILFKQYMVVSLHQFLFRSFKKITYKLVICSKSVMGSMEIDKYDTLIESGGYAWKKYKKKLFGAVMRQSCTHATELLILTLWKLKICNMIIFVLKLELFYFFFKFFHHFSAKSWQKKKIITLTICRGFIGINLWFSSFKINHYQVLYQISSKSGDPVQ